MSVFRRGKTWWFNFWWEGTHIQRSTHQSNKRTAETMEAAERTRLAKREVGIVDKKPSQSFKQFSGEFRDHIKSKCETRPESIRFYLEKHSRLLEYQPLASAKLDEIDEQLIERYKNHRRRMKTQKGSNFISPASVNRELATLSLVLNLAFEHKLINRVPKIRKFKGEGQREFVISPELEVIYFNSAPTTLKDAALLMLDAGLRAGEVVNLRWIDIHLNQPTEKRNGSNGYKYGFIKIREGKSKNAQRSISLTLRLRDMLISRKSISTSEWLFPSSTSKNHIRVTSLDHLHSSLRDELGLPSEFVLHSLRHSFLTRLGETGVDAFTLAKIAGHGSIVTSQRYVHPSSELMNKSLEKMERMNARRLDATTSATTENLELQLEDS